MGRLGQWRHVIDTGKSGGSGDSSGHAFDEVIRDP